MFFMGNFTRQPSIRPKVKTLWKLFKKLVKLAVSFLYIFVRFCKPLGKNARKSTNDDQSLILKLTLHIVLFAFLFVTGSALMAQARNEGSRLVDARLAMKGTEINENYIFINYEIPYSGMVEIRLFDGSGQQIWQNQYDHSYGENRIVLRASKFNPGETYAYVLNYKRDMVRETLIVP
jgi:hypothetical protein